MQLQFQPTVHSCMQRVVWETKSEEQSQEVRRPGSGQLGSGVDPQ